MLCVLRNVSVVVVRTTREKITSRRTQTTTRSPLETTKSAANRHNDNQRNNTQWVAVALVTRFMGHSDFLSFPMDPEEEY